MNDDRNDESTLLFFPKSSCELCCCSVLVEFCDAIGNRFPVFPPNV